MYRIIRQLWLSGLLLLTTTAGFGTRPADHRALLEADYNDYIDSQRFKVDYGQAKDYFTGVIRESEQHGYWDLCLGALSMLAYIGDINYHHDVMKDAVEKGSQIMAKQSVALDSMDPRYYIRTEMMLMVGAFYVRNCDLNKAADVFNNLVDRLNKTKNPDKFSLFKSYAYLADLYIDMGLHDKVDSYYHLMHELLPENDDLSAYVYLQYIASSYDRNRKFDRARSTLREAGKKMPSHITIQWKPYVVSNYKLMASLFQQTGKYDSANLYLRKCMKLLSPGDPLIGDIYEMYGDGLTHERNYVEALQYFSKILSIINKEPNYNISRKAQILSKIAEACLKQGKFNEAVMTTQQAFAILYKDPSYRNTAAKNPDPAQIHPDKISLGLLMTKSNALFEAAKNNRREGNPYGDALATYMLTSNVLDNFRHRIATDDFKEFFVQDIRSFYENAIMACYEAYRLAPDDSVISFAYYFIEKSKNQVLMDAIRQDQARKYCAIPDSLIDKEFRFKRRLVAFQNDLYALNFRNADPEIIRNCMSESALLQHEYERFLKTLEKNYPEYYLVKYSDITPSIRDIKKTVRKNILIEYLDGAHSVAMIAFSRGQTLFRVFQKDPVFDASLNAFIQTLYHSNDYNWYEPENYRRFAGQAYYLYQKLLGPVLGQFPKARELILIPDGRLCYLPFEALISRIPGEKSALDYEKLQYLLFAYAVRYEYSAGLFDFQRSRSKRFAAHNSDYAGFAPRYDSPQEYKKVQVLGRRTGYLSDLKYNTEEVEAAAEIFNGKAYLGDEATQQQFRNAISSRIIHFAGHTVINDSIPELSGMFFSGQRGMNGKDEVLYLDEMFNLNMNIRLAILSGCETGVGRLLKGEGLGSIGRAFKYAGCKDLVMTLWKINDRSASLLIRKFCVNLRLGIPTASAMRKAKIECIEGSGIGRSANPLYWSAFIMVGSNEPLFRRYVAWFVGAGFAGIILTIFVLLVFTKTFRRRSHIK
jgi:CHAT domain-containing protein